MYAQAVWVRFVAVNDSITEQLAALQAAMLVTRSSLLHTQSKSSRGHDTGSRAFAQAACSDQDESEGVQIHTQLAGRQTYRAGRKGRQQRLQVCLRVGGADEAERQRQQQQAGPGKVHGC